MTSPIQPDPSSTPPGYPGSPAPAAAAAPAGNGLATAGFVLGLLGFLGSFIPVINVGGIVLGVIGVILAAIGLVKAKKVGSGKRLALAGIILGVLAVIIAIVINVAFVNVVSDSIDSATKATVTTNTDDAPASDAATADDDAPTENDVVDGDEPAVADATADGELGATRSNPAPLGSSITGDDWTVTVNSVSTSKTDDYEQKAAKGSVLLLVNVTATYTGDDEQGDTAWIMVKYVTADGTTIDSSDGSTFFMAKNSFDSAKTVYEGGSVTGNEILEVPADSWQDGVLAISPTLFADSTFVAVK